MLQRCAGSSSLALIDIKKPPTLRNKERSPLLRSVASFLIYTNTKELEPGQSSRIHFAQTNSMRMRVREAWCSETRAQGDLPGVLRE